MFIHNKTEKTIVVYNQSFFVDVAAKDSVELSQEMLAADEVLNFKYFGTRGIETSGEWKKQSTTMSRSKHSYSSRTIFPTVTVYRVEQNFQELFVYDGDRYFFSFPCVWHIKVLQELSLSSYDEEAELERKYHDSQSESQAEKKPRPDYTLRFWDEETKTKFRRKMLWRAILAVPVAMFTTLSALWYPFMPKEEGTTLMLKILTEICMVLIAFGFDFAAHGAITYFKKAKAWEIETDRYLDNKKKLPHK